MNTIQTLGDLKKALSVYPDKLPVKFRSSDRKFWLNNDTQIALVQEPLAGGSAMYTEISLIPEPVISRKPVFVGFESPTNSSGETMNYKLLRPFDLEAAKAGAKITDKTEIEHTFAAEAGPDGDMAVRDPQGNIFVMDLSEARMVPLAWVEGKPVYPGDVLYWNDDSTKSGSKFTAGNRVLPGGLITGVSVVINGPVYNTGGMHSGKLTWNPPKVKKEGWINLYSKNGMSKGMPVTGGQILPTKAVADNEAFDGRVACVRIEWDE